MKPAPAPVAAPSQAIAAEPTWTLAMVGLCVFTVSVVTVRIPLGDVGVLLGVLGVVLQGRTARFPPPLTLFAIFVAWAGMTAVFSEYPETSLERTVDRIKLLAIFFVALNALRTEKQVRYFSWLYLLSFMLSPGRGALGGYALGNTVFGRAVWNYNYSNPNDLAAYSLLALGIALVLATSSREPRFLRLLAWGSAVVLILIIFLTQSRGVMLGAALALVPAALLTIRRRPAALLYASIAAVAVAYFVPQSALDRFSDMRFLTNTETIAQADAEGSAANRYEVAVAAWEMTLARPFMGSGLGTYIPVMAREYPELGPKDTHNTYLNLSAELGLPGLILWCAMVISVLKMSSRARKLAVRADLEPGINWVDIAFIGFMIAGIFGSYSAVSYLYPYMGLIWCRGLILSDAANARLANPGVAAAPGAR